jgi:hypothetical protein
LADGLSARETRVFNPRPRRHHRPRYSLAEVRIGAGVVALLGLIAGWVAWRGAHPDPDLFGEPKGAGAAAARVVERGALPPALAAFGWRERGLARFGPDRLYEKIDGRADYFLSRGCRSLSFVTLEREASAATAVDLELYDMGSAQNALGALAGEKPPEVRASSAAGTQWYAVRNALFLSRGSHYARAIGSDESAEVQAQLAALRSALEARLPAGERPWSHALFADALGVAPDRIEYHRENAFSFGFARNVHAALLDDGESEAFVAPSADAGAAQALAERFERGFLEYGTAVPRGGATWVKDRYLGSFARAQSEGAMVLGIRGAPRIEAAEAALARLRVAVTVLPAEVVVRAARLDDGQAAPAREPAYE